MAACGMPAADAPVVTLTLVGNGEPLLRMQKRLACAASGLGLRLALTLNKNSDALGIPYAQTPAVMMDERVILSGLPRTEDIETWLTRFISTRQTP